MKCSAGQHHAVLISSINKEAVLIPSTEKYSASAGNTTSLTLIKTLRSSSDRSAACTRGIEWVPRRRTTLFCASLIDTDLTAATLIRADMRKVDLSGKEVGQPPVRAGPVQQKANRLYSCRPAVPMIVGRAATGLPGRPSPRTSVRGGRAPTFG